MGSEKKSRKRRSSSNSEDDGRGEKHKREDSEGKRKRSKEKVTSKKSRKHSRDDSDKRTKSKEKHSRKRQKHNHDSNFEELSTDDYFTKNNEFSTWLKEEKGIFFSDLSSEDAHKLFSKFVKDWNRQKLSSHYYEGIKSAPRTAHNWKIVKDK